MFPKPPLGVKNRVVGSGSAALADQPKPLHIRGMIRFIVPIFMFGTAVVVATILVVVAHFGLGIARSTIRTDALAGIIFVGIALAGSTLLKRNK